jgi:hypothetical protein
LCFQLRETEENDCSKADLRLSSMVVSFDPRPRPPRRADWGRLRGVQMDASILK